MFQILKTKIMIKKILIGLVSISVLAFITLYFSSRPNLEEDGSYSPSSLALILGTVSKTDFEEIKYTKYQGDKSKVFGDFYGAKKPGDEKWQILFYR